MPEFSLKNGRFEPVFLRGTDFHGILPLPNNTAKTSFSENLLKIRKYVQPLPSSRVKRKKHRTTTKIRRRFRWQRAAPSNKSSVCGMRRRGCGNRTGCKYLRCAKLRYTRSESVTGGRIGLFSIGVCMSATLLIKLCWLFIKCRTEWS